jgi:hypothetical protein
MNITSDENQLHTRSVVLDLVLTILFCGLWNGVVQYSQMKTLNYLYKEERYSFWKFSLYSLLTCGVYYIYHEYRKADDYQRFIKSPDTSEPVLALVLALFGFGWIYDAILQSKLNEYLVKPVPLDPSSFMPPENRN